ncbi:MAG TPA: hypothetical protein VIT44_01135 [Cyclobacteriaceae bacterium]
MENSKTIETHWLPDEKLIVTQIAGDVTKEDILNWKKGLEHSLDQIADNSSFKIFVNLYGFKAIDLEAHKSFRGIVPLTLADYGWKVGYVNLFDESSSMALKNERGIKCVAAAHTHQDASKIEQYEIRFGRDEEHFFTDPQKAEEWIKAIPVN